MNRWEKHCELIGKYCDVKAVNSKGILYVEEGYATCELRNGEMYAPVTLAEFEELCEEMD